MIKMKKSHFCNFFQIYFGYSNTQSLSYLHWLPVKSRINFKYYVLTYKASHSGHPAYLREYLKPYAGTRCSNPELRYLDIPRFSSRVYKIKLTYPRHSLSRPHASGTSYPHISETLIQQIFFAVSSSDT